LSEPKGERGEGGRQAPGSPTRAEPGEEPSAAPQPRPGSRDRPLRVSQLVRGANHVLEQRIGTIWVEGEVESVSRASSGHVYFCLKDARSQLKAVLWRADAARLKFAIANGQSLLCRGKLGVYDRDGKLQLYVDAAEPAGLGADALALEQLKARLAAEGLFASERKRPLPLLPQRIGVVTSKSGAAVRDIIKAVERRFPVPILIADTRVQGPNAPATIARAIAAVGRAGVDVVIVGRGGGSAGDLAAFNDERVVRAVRACPVPVISAVGHEIDLSLTDLAADRRAATPTMAGEMAVPVRAELAKRLEHEERRLRRELDHRLRVARQEIDHLEARARHRLHGSLEGRRRRLAEGLHRLEALQPRSRMVAHRARLDELSARAARAVQRRVHDGARRFGSLGARLDALSPLRVLERGYAIALAGEHHVLCDAREVAPGAQLTVRLHRGALGCRVETVEPDEP
jgi:exodeoxyribonuclease VII large subunit